MVLISDQDVLPKVNAIKWSRAVSNKQAFDKICRFLRSESERRLVHSSLSSTSPSSPAALYYSSIDDFSHWEDLCGTARSLASSKKELQLLEQIKSEGSTVHRSGWSPSLPSTSLVPAAQLPVKAEDITPATPETEPVPNQKALEKIEAKPDENDLKKAEKEAMKAKKEAKKARKEAKKAKKEAKKAKKESKKRKRDSA